MIADKESLKVTRYLILSLLTGFMFSAQPVWAQSAGYHLERLQIQARAFLETLPPPPAPGTQTSATVEEQLSPSGSVWSRKMVETDVNAVVQTAQQLSSKLSVGMAAKDLTSAQATLESLGRRLRVSSAALTLPPQSRTALDFLLLELDESAKIMASERAQLASQQRQLRRARPVTIGVGMGYWGVPYGWGSYYPYGYGPGPSYYPGFPGFGPRCW